MVFRLYAVDPFAKTRGAKFAEGLIHGSQEQLQELKEGVELAKEVRMWRFGMARVHFVRYLCHPIPYETSPISVIVNEREGVQYPSIGFLEVCTTLKGWNDIYS